MVSRHFLLVIQLNQNHCTVRNRSKELVELLGDVEKIRSERRKAKNNRNKYTGVGNEALSFSSGGSRYGGFGSESPGYGGSSSGYGGGGSGNYGGDYSSRGPFTDFVHICIVLTICQQIMVTILQEVAVVSEIRLRGKHTTNTMLATTMLFPHVVPTLSEVRLPLPQCLVGQTQPMLPPLFLRRKRKPLSLRRTSSTWTMTLLHLWLLHLLQLRIRLCLSWLLLRIVRNLHESFLYM